MVDESHLSLQRAALEYLDQTGAIPAIKEACSRYSSTKVGFVSSDRLTAENPLVKSLPFKESTEGGIDRLQNGQSFNDKWKKSKD